MFSFIRETALSILRVHARCFESVRVRRGEKAHMRGAHENDVAARSISGSCNSHCSPLLNARLASKRRHMEQW